MTLSPLVVGFGLATLLAVVALIMYSKSFKRNYPISPKHVDEMELRSFIKTMQSALRTADFNIPKHFDERTKKGSRKVAVVVTVSCKPNERKIFDIFLDVGQLTTRITIETSRLMKEQIESYLQHAGFEFNQ